MLQELLDILATGEFEHDGEMCLVGASWKNHRTDLKTGLKTDLELQVEVFTGKEPLAQQWIFLCRGELTHRIVLNCCGDIELSHDHVLLWPYRCLNCALWFKGSGENVAAVVGDLSQAHQETVGDWFDFNYFFNTSANSQSLSELLVGGYGKLAVGPEPLILAYQSVLQKHGIVASTTSWAAHNHDGLGSDELVVLLIGASRVIAESVSAQRIE